MVQCIGRIKGTENWMHVSLGFQPFRADEGIMKEMVAAMEKKYPNIEYKIIPAESQ